MCRFLMAQNETRGEGNQVDHGVSHHHHHTTPHYTTLHHGTLNQVAPGMSPGPAQFATRTDAAQFPNGTFSTPPLA